MSLVKMASKSRACALLYFFIFFVEVSPWTIDLPQVRRYVFDKHEQHKKISKNEYDDFANNDRAFYSNAQGNSKHNSDENKMYGEYDKVNYANEFKHQSYMEKKVLEIVHDGSRYLEGLRRSLEDYNTFLQQCNSQNTSMVPNITNIAPPPPQWTLNGTTAINSTTQLFNTTGWQTINSTGVTGLNTRSRVMTCREATQASERVRRYVDLAMWATRRLQDIAYAQNYQKTDQYEENELILKLAWFLDQLALLTGYEPDHDQYLPRRATTTPTTSPSPVTMVPQTDELRNYLISCVKTNSSVPATIRCNYPLPLPDLVAQLTGGTSTSPPQRQNSDVVPTPPAAASAQQSMELLVTADDYRNPRKITKRSPNPEEYYVPIPIHEKPPKPIVDFIVKKLSNLKAIVKTVKKHAVEDFASQIAYHKHLHKRSINEDTSLLVNRLSNSINIKPIDKLVKTNVNSDNLNVESNESVKKSDKSNVTSDESVLKSDEFNVKLNDTFVDSDGIVVKSEESIDKSNEPLVEIISPLHFPISDVSVVNTKSFKKRSIASSNLLTTDKKNVKSVRKRSVDDPLTKLTKYYVKYKVWDNSNPLQAKNDEKTKNYDIDNHIQPKKISKRSLFIKKNTHLRLPKPFQTPISQKKKSKIQSNKQKLTKYLGDLIEKKHKKYGSTHKLFKRSLIYEDMYLPRIPTNPVGDISYYVKSKPGTFYNPSLLQAAQVRLGLQQVFETGNLAVIQRYGSNYNPAVPAPFWAGVFKGMADA